MIKVLFTSDYEIHGNGEGSPLKLMYNTTERMIKKFNKYGAKLTIMADVSEILQFKKYFENSGIDHFNYDDISKQLKRAVRTGHDVQLHIHPSYNNAVYYKNSWKWKWEEHDLANLSYERLNDIIKEGKKFLETLIQSENPEYKCFTFRTANWSMIPSYNIIKALIENNICFDTSVFKWGKRSENG
jgi:hypothetical protein